jgi:hypothetical protein
VRNAVRLDRRQLCRERRLLRRDLRHPGRCGERHLHVRRRSLSRWRARWVDVRRSRCPARTARFGASA